MKNRFLKVAAFIMCVMLSVTAAGCGNNGKGTESGNMSHYKEVTQCQEE